MDQNKSPSVSIIIVNWNSASFLHKCLDLLYSDEESVSFEIIVVDNASYDGSAELIYQEFKKVRFFQLDKNLGFAGANNFGSKQALGEVLLFLNPDTEPSPCSVRILSEMVIENPNAGAAGCLLLNTDGTVQISSLMPFPTLLTEILDNEFLMTKLSWIPIWGVKPLFSKKRIDSTSVSVISGACLAVRKEVFDAVGGFSEEYFMYSEDVDLCYKIKKSGKTNIFTNRCTVVHHGGGSSRQHPISAFSAKMMLESKKMYFRLHHGPLFSFTFNIVILLTALIRLIMITLLLPFLLLSKRNINGMYGKCKINLCYTLTSIINIPKKTQKNQWLFTSKSHKKKGKKTTCEHA